MLNNYNIMEWGMSEDIMGAIVPVIAYWVYSGMYVVLGNFKCMEKRRLHPKGEEDEKNIVGRLEVVRGVLVQQACQIAVVVLAYSLTSDDKGASRRPRSWAVTCIQIFLGMVILDTWEYMMHRTYHSVPFLYRHVHATHHTLVVPYAYGALYNTPWEGLISETLGGAIAFLVSGMTPRTSVFLFTLATIKTVDDHCGMWLPSVNPFHLLFENNAACHDVHHQLYGSKYNFSAPFFVAWDKILGTYMPYEVVPRDAGGLQVRPKLKGKKD